MKCWHEPSQRYASHAQFAFTIIFRNYRHLYNYADCRDMVTELECHDKWENNNKTDKDTKPCTMIVPPTDKAVITHYHWLSLRSSNSLRVFTQPKGSYMTVLIMACQVPTSDSLLKSILPLTPVPPQVPYFQISDNNFVCISACILMPESRHRSATSGAR